MIERQGYVLAVSNGIATIRVEPPSACAQCGSRGACGGASARTLEIAAPPLAHPGATVTIALAESNLLRAALLAYGLPAGTTLMGAVLLSGAGDLAAVAGALCGLGLGWTALRHFGRQRGCAVSAFVSQPSGDAS